MKLNTLILLVLVIASTAHAATTNISPPTVTSTHGFFEGRASIGTLANMTDYQLFVTNQSLFGDAVVVNNTLLAETVYGEVGIFDFLQANSTLLANGDVDFSGATSILGIGPEDLPSTIAYEDEANTFTLRQVYSAGFTAGANAYHDALLTINGSGTPATRLMIRNGGTVVVGDVSPGVSGLAINPNSYTISDGNDRPYFRTDNSGTVMVSTNDITSLRNFLLVSPAVDIPAGRTVTTASTFYVGGAWVKTGAGTLTNNLAFWIDDGTMRIDGEIDHNGATAGFLGVTPVVQQACVAAATGGAVIDAQARTAANGALAALKAFGFMAGGC